MVDNRPLFRTHFDEFSTYLADYLAKVAPESREVARAKLSSLTAFQFLELSIDAYDEVIRRKENKEPFLPLCIDYHQNRNRAREKLATLPLSGFQDLCGDVHFELARRFPEFKADLDRQSSAKCIQEVKEELERFRDRCKMLEQSQTELCSRLIESFMVDLNDLSNQAIESATAATTTESPDDAIRLSVDSLLKEYRSKYERIKAQVSAFEATPQMHEMESEIEKADQQPGPSDHLGHERQVATAVESDTMSDGFVVQSAADRDIPASANPVTAVRVAEVPPEEGPDPVVDSFDTLHERIKVTPGQLEVASGMSATRTGPIDVLDPRTGQPSDDVSQTEGSSSVQSSRTAEQSPDKPPTSPGPTSSPTSDFSDWEVTDGEM